MTTTQSKSARSIRPAQPALDELRELVKVLASLPTLSPIERARAVAKLDRSAHSPRSLIALVGDEAIQEAGETHTQAEIAEQLSVTSSRIMHRITRYRQWVATRSPAVAPVRRRTKS